MTEPIGKLRAALDQYPNDSRPLYTLLYALYVDNKDEKFCREHHAEILSFAY